MEPKYKVLGSFWYTPNMPGLDTVETAVLIGDSSIVVGFVAIASGPDEDKWKVYCGLAIGNWPKEAMEQQIAANGCKVMNEVARAHFPDLPAKGLLF